MIAALRRPDRLLAAVASRGAQTSRVRTVQLLPAIPGSVCLFIALTASVMVAHANALSCDASEPPVLDREFGTLIGIGVVGFLVGVGAGPLLAQAVLGTGPIESYASLQGVIPGGFLGAGLAASAWRRPRPPRRLEGPRRHR